MERARTIVKMEKAKLDLRWLREFDTKSLTACCGRIAESLPELAEQERNIQRELIQSPGFAAFYAKLLAAFSKEGGPDGGIYPFFLNRLDDLLEACRKHGHDVSAYSVENITDILKPQNLSGYKRLVLLENFDLCGWDKDTQGNVARNICRCLDLPLTLSGREKIFLQEPFIGTSSLVSSAPFGAVFALLDRHPELLDIARLLHEKGVEDNLVLKDYQKMAESVPGYVPPLRKLIASLELAPLNMFLKYWEAGGCQLHELQAMKRLLDTQPSQDWPALLGTRSAYTNTLYGRKFKSFELSELGEDKEGVVIYAIAHSKKHFIKLVDGHPDLFLQLPSRSILFQKGFYDGHFNINELTEKTLKAFAGVTTYSFRPDRLKLGRRYSFQEIQALSGKGSAYWTFYHALTSPSQDYRLLVFRQVCKNELLSGLQDEKILTLAAMLDKKPLHNWRQEDFGHIQGLRPHEVVQLLLHVEELRHLIPTMHNQEDLSIALRSSDTVSQFDSIDALKGGLLQSDANWQALAKRMGLSLEFLAQHKENIIRFLCRDGASVVQTYLGCLRKERQEAFLRVVKAELMGKLHELKYFAGDLQRELDTPVTDKIKEGWEKCLSLSDKGITVEERDGFFSTMFAGAQPQRTCLSYINGAYRACLLSGFDSNKKLLYASIGGRIVGRAFLRLTKASLSGKADTNLTFVDLEAAAPAQQEEKAVLFLERPYISGVSPEKKEQAICLFQELARKKALELGVALVLSWSYYSYVLEGFTQTRLNLYISKSKAGCQYLDSLDGQAAMDTEGSYKAGRFLVCQAGKIFRKTN